MHHDYDFQFEFYAAKLVLERDKDDDFWRSFDAINEDLVNYIYNWIDIRYFNYLIFKPYHFVDDEIDVFHAMQESEKNGKTC